MADDDKTVNHDTGVPTKRIGRRSVLKGAAAVAGTAAGSGAITGFPTIWAQNIRDITLLHLGSSYSAIIDIARQATEDLGFTVEMQNSFGDALVNRVATQPNSVDIAELEFWAVRRVYPRGEMRGIDVNRVNQWNNMVPIFTQGTYPDGSQVSRQGTAPFEVQYATAEDTGEFADGPTGWATTIPTVYNADTLGIRPDVIDRPIETWSELLNPEFAGRSAIVDIPSIGIMDAAMAIESRGDITYGDKGNMTREEIDQTVDILIELKRAGHFRAFWSTFDESVNLMASGEVVIQSMWSPAVTAVRTQGINCEYVPLREGYRGWGAGLGLMRHLDGLKLDAAYEYVNWYLSGWQGGFIAKQGYYSAVPETARQFLTEDEWNYWYEGQVAQGDILDPYGNLMESAGNARDGGAFWERMGNIACWNTVMDENRYMVRKWNEFIAA